MADRPRAKVFQSPKYIQQPGALAHIGEFVAEAFPKAKNAALITSARLRKQYIEQLSQSVVDPGAPAGSTQGSGAGAATLPTPDMAYKTVPLWLLQS